MSGKRKKSDKHLFPADMLSQIEQFVRTNNLNLCLECGKCSAVCPMLKLYGEYLFDRSPRGVIKRMSLDPGMLDDEALWYCLACDECSFYCPSGVDLKNFMISLRELLITYGYTEHAVFCSECGTYLMPKNELEYLIKDSGYVKTKDLLAVCERCKQKNYTETLRRVAPLVKK